MPDPIASSLLQIGLNVRQVATSDVTQPALESHDTPTAANGGLFRADELECLKKFEAIDPHVRDMLDMPELVCTDTHSSLALNLKRQDLPSQSHHATQNITLSFPRRENHVVADHREQVFITGPESSGTTFVYTFVQAAYGLPIDDQTDANGKVIHIDDVSLANTAIHHLSLPEGAFCRDHDEEPVLQDFAKPNHTSADLPRRFFVNMSAVAQAHHIRNATAKIVQVARNPSVSLRSKMMRAHCNDLEASKAEQKLAFALMLEAMNRSDIVTVCYEQLMAEGISYLIDKLAAIGIDANGKDDLPAVSQGDTEATIGEAFECDQDVEAYMTLCPESPDTKLFRESCG
jgi:hypothetical protein